MRKKIILSVLLVVQVILVNAFSFFPDFIEVYYSNGIYPVIAKIFSSFFGLFPFSVGDVLYGVVIFFAVGWLWKKRSTWQKHYKDNLLTILSFLSVFYFLFYFLWALNYHRIPLNEKLNIEKAYTPEELVDFTKRVIEKTNQLHEKIQKSDTVKVQIPYTIKELYNKSADAFFYVEKDFPFFSYETRSIKSSLISIPLSYMGFNGYLNPFTNEAQVNDKIPKYNFSTTACHEIAHQIGYASESEANFIGYMASVYSEDLYLNYSGYSFALKYCLRNIRKINHEQAEALMPLINKGVLLNFQESEDFNDRYQSFIEVFFKAFYDNFLKLNHQEEGLETYSRFVGLLVNYYKDKEL